MDRKISERKRVFEERRKNPRHKHVSIHYLSEYIVHLNKTPVYREANAVYRLLDNVDLPLYPEEEIVGILNFSEPVYFNYGGGTVIEKRLVEKYISQEALSGKELDRFLNDIKSVEERHYKGANPAIFSDEELNSINAHAATSTWFGGHMVLDYESILTNGLDVYLTHIDLCREKNIDKSEFYSSMEITLKAVQNYITRYCIKAKHAAADPGFVCEKFTKISADLEIIAHAPPQTFRQALQLVWILHILNGADSFGRFDKYLYEIYRRDREENGLTWDKAFYLLSDFFIKVEQANQIQNMTIGGVTEEGEPVYNDLTRMCIEAAAILHYKGPNLCLRITKDMPGDIWEAALDCLETGAGVPALYNDGIYISSLVSHGYELETARNYCLAGCSQIMIPGMSNFYNDVGMLNIAKVFELTLYNGFDPRTNNQVGLKTGEVSEFLDYNSFYNAFCRQIDYFCDLEVTINDKDTLYRASCEGYAMRSLFTKDCLSRGIGVFSGGARYNNIELEVIGITNAADSLYAVKKAIFEKRTVTFENLLKALKSNFDGNAYLLNWLKKLEKFGNDHAELDDIRGRITKRIFDNFNGSKAVLGGIYVPGEVIFTAHEHSGRVTGATPDGRTRGDILADSAGASQGADINGPTALLGSVLKIPVENYLLTTVVVNLKFSKEMFGKLKEKIKQLFQTFFNRGGMQLQINVISPDELIKAVNNPEKYRSLIVRVGGYSDYFVNLSKPLQDEIIRRSIQEL